jgi:biotin carboxyl carrier protein
MVLELAIEGHDPHTVSLTRRGAGATITIDGRDYETRLTPAGDAYELSFETRSARVWAVVDHDRAWAHAFGRSWTLSLIDPVERAQAGRGSEDIATAPMPGTVIRVAVQPGEVVTAGQQLVVIESMKMQSEIVAVRDGVVETIYLMVGETFDRGAPLVALAAPAGGDGAAS